MESVGKAFTPPSEPENFRFLEKERPVTRQFSSPICEMNQGDTDCDIPPLQEAKKNKKSLCTMNKNRLHPPPRQRLLPRLWPLATSGWSGRLTFGAGRVREPRVREPRVLSSGLCSSLRSQGSEFVFPSLRQLDSSGFSIWHLQPRAPPLSPLQPAGREGQSSSAFAPQLCPVLQDTARSMSPLALKISSGGQGGLPRGAVARMERSPRPRPFTLTHPGPLPSPPLCAQHLPEPGPSTSSTYFPRPLTPSGC